MKKFSISKTVGPSHLDSRGQLSIRSLVDFMQDCSIFQLDSEEELARYFKDTNSGMFLSQRQIEILRLPMHGEELTIKTWVYKCNPTYGFRNTNVYDAQGNACVVSSALGVFVDYETGTLIRVPRDIMDTVPIFDAYKMEYLPRKISVPKDIEVREFAPFYVWKFMIDANNHVNNARYISLAQEYLPDDFIFNSIQVEYLVAARQGEYIYPKRIEEGDGYIILLESEEGKRFSILKFTNK